MSGIESIGKALVTDPNSVIGGGPYAFSGTPAVLAYPVGTFGAIWAVLDYVGVNAGGEKIHYLVPVSEDQQGLINFSETLAECLYLRDDEYAGIVLHFPGDYKFIVWFEEIKGVEQQEPVRLSDRQTTGLVMTSRNSLSRFRGPGWMPLSAENEKLLGDIPNLSYADIASVIAGSQKIQLDIREIKRESIRSEKGADAKEDEAMNGDLV